MPRFTIRFGGFRPAPPDPQDGMRPRCATRGYCGPFLNAAYYSALETWAGFGECVECGCTVPIPRGTASSGSFEEPVGARPA